MLDAWKLPLNRVCRGRCELWRQHRLWPQIPQAPGRPLGHRGCVPEVSCAFANEDLHGSILMRQRVLHLARQCMFAGVCSGHVDAAPMWSIPFCSHLHIDSCTCTRTASTPQPPSNSGLCPCRCGRLFQCGDVPGAAGPRRREEALHHRRVRRRVHNLGLPRLQVSRSSHSQYSGLLDGACQGSRTREDAAQCLLEHQWFWKAPCHLAFLMLFQRLL